MSKNNLNGLCILNFLFFWPAQKDTGPHHPSEAIYGRFNYDMIRHNIKNKPEDKQLAHFV